MPVIVARNSGDTETVITGRIPYTANDGSVSVLTLPQFRLSAGETKELHLTAALRSGHLPQNLKSAGLEFEYTGAPGSVVMSAQSVGDDGNQVFRMPLLDPAAMPSATGGYPWSVDGDASTMIYIKNVTDRPQQYNLSLNFAGGVYAPGLKVVAAGQTVALDVRALRDNQTPDEAGRTIPHEATRGQVNWSMRGAENHVLIGRAEQADLAHGMSSTYACANCCPDSFSGGFISPGQATGFPGDETQFFASEFMQNCYGQVFPPYRVSASFAAVPEEGVVDCPFTGLVTGQAPGTAMIEGRWMTGTWSRGLSEQCEYTPVEVLREALCDVLGIDVSIDPGEIRPMGTTGGTNTATIYVSTPMPNQAITLRLSEDTESRGGHVAHTGQRPLGSLAQTQGVSDAGGLFQTRYTAPAFGGKVIVTASVRSYDVAARILEAVQKAVG